MACEALRAPSVLQIGDYVAERHQRKSLRWLPHRCERTSINNPFMTPAVDVAKTRNLKKAVRQIRWRCQPQGRFEFLQPGSLDTLGFTFRSGGVGERFLVVVEQRSLILRLR